VTDAARLEAIFRAHHGAVLGYALRRTDRATAEEVVADAFLVCWRRLDDVPADPLPWLFAVARRCLANRRRSAGRVEALGQRVAERAAQDHGRDPGDVVGAQDAIRLALEALPEGDRELLQLVAWEGLDARRAAQALGCSRATFDVRLHRARKRLAARLDSDPVRTIA
jgi:RNA polymerase sigma-70 factor (ECF subfamily)